MSSDKKMAGTEKSQPIKYGNTFKNSSSDGFAGHGHPIHEHGKPKATGKGGKGGSDKRSHSY